MAIQQHPLSLTVLRPMRSPTHRQQMNLVCSNPSLYVYLLHCPIKDNTTTMASIKITNIVQLYQPTNPHSPMVAFVQVHTAMDQLGCLGGQTSTQGCPNTTPTANLSLELPVPEGFLLGSAATALPCHRAGLGVQGLVPTRILTRTLPTPA